MTEPPPIRCTPSPGFLARLRSGGVRADDSPEEQLNKSLLLLATGLVCIASILWLAVYWSLGPKLSATLPFAYQLLLAGNLLLYIRSGNFKLFRNTQLGLFLFVPFVAQWAIGNFITASGILLWGLLAPIGAILCIGAREALAWFFAYAFLIVMTGVFDFYLADANTYRNATVSVETSVVFFALNFLAISTIVFLLLRFAIEQKQLTARRLAEAHTLLEIEQERSERLLLNILPGPVAERLKQNETRHRRRFCGRQRDVRRHRQLHAGRRGHDTGPGVFHAQPGVFSFRRTRRGARAGKDQDHRRRLHGGRRPERRTQRLFRRHCRSGAGNARLAAATRLPPVNEMHLEVRIGIGTGPVVAGVVGKKKFIYDLWGDTVNIASRITSEGVPGMVQVDDTTTYHRLRSASTFTNRRRSTSRARAIPWCTGRWTKNGHPKVPVSTQLSDRKPIRTCGLGRC
jgi:adenylate cyclase